jgi:hypothetical protein
MLETPRLTPYLSNGLPVVSELGLDSELNAAYKGMVAFVPEESKQVRGGGGHAKVVL